MAGVSSYDGRVLDADDDPGTPRGRTEYTLRSVGDRRGAADRGGDLLRGVLPHHLPTGIPGRDRARARRVAHAPGPSGGLGPRLRSDPGDSWPSLPRPVPRS